MLHSLKKLWLCTKPTDMRRSYDGLSAMVKNDMQSDPLNGEGFIFINRKRTQLKCLYFDPGGYCLWGKRLEAGLFANRFSLEENKLLLSTTEWFALIEGFEVELKKRHKRYKKRSI